MLLKVPSQLILRLKSHFHILPIGIDLIIGVNGWIWIAQQRAQSDADEGLKEGFEAESDNMYSDVNEVSHPFPPICQHFQTTSETNRTFPFVDIIAYFKSYPSNDSPTSRRHQPHVHALHAHLGLINPTHLRSLVRNLSAISAGSPIDGRGRLVARSCSYSSGFGRVLET
jgi:hypothetical protein